MMEKMLKFDDIEICTESFGDPGNSCILLIMGATASMIWWDDEFCRRLAQKGRFVIRYDNRDTGRSTCYTPGSPPPYSVTDMADDGLKVMDFYGVKKAHIAGMSLGGMIAQLIALRNPDRVLSITLISSSVWDDIPELPQIDRKILQYHASAADLDWTDREAVIRYLVGGWRILNGSKHTFDQKRAEELAKTEQERANCLLSMFNHSMLKGGEGLYGRTKEITIPALIIHGTEDPVLPFAHAEELKKTLPDSTLIALEGSGHELHKEEWDRVISGIIDISR